MTQGFSKKSPYAQPLPDVFPHQILHGLQEEVDYLPGTHIRVWFTYLPTAYPRHWHDCMEIVEGVHSHYTVRVGETACTVSQGDILILPPGMQHDLVPGPECNGWIYLFDLSWLRGIPSAGPLLDSLTQHMLVSQQEKPALYMNLASVLSQMRNVYFSDNADREILFDSAVLLLLTQLKQEIRVAGEDDRFDKRHAHGDMFNQVLSYIDSNFSRELSLDSMAKHFNLSSAYFSRLFAQYVHEPFGTYLANRRLKEAERLLADPSLSITDVALRCGYSSTSAFSRAFLAQRRCRPSQFRRIYREFMRDSTLRPEAGSSGPAAES